MDRVRRSATTPEIISLSKNHSNFPISFPPTKPLKDHVLKDGSTAHGVGFYDEHDKVAYVIGHPSHKKPLSGPDRILLITLLARIQINIRKMKKEGLFKPNDYSNYSLTFPSIYKLLKFLDMPDTPYYYSRITTSLKKLTEINIYFIPPYHTGKKRETESMLITGLIDSVKSNWDDESHNRLLIRMNKDWVDMNEGCFLMYTREQTKKLTESEFNLLMRLEPWRETMIKDCYILKRNFSTFCDRLGLNPARPKKELNKALKHIVKKVNTICETEYAISFEKDLVLLVYGDPALISNGQ